MWSILLSDLLIAVKGMKQENMLSFQDERSFRC